MSKGVLSLMKNTVSGLIKIGSCETKQYQERMRYLERNGYYNVVGLKRFLAIELDDYKQREKLFHNIFSKRRVGESELFPSDAVLIKERLLAFEGRLIYPETKDKAKEFETISKTNAENNQFGFL